jgi:hypothetical protein
MANPVRERGGSSLYLGKGTFDIVPISVALDLKLESYPVECRVEMSRGINEKQRVVDMVFLLQLSEEYPGECLSSSAMPPARSAVYLDSAGESRRPLPTSDCLQGSSV